MKITFRAITSSFKYLPIIIKDNALLILAFFLPCEVLHHFFMLMQKTLEAGGVSTWPAQIGEVLAGLLTFIFYTMLMPLRMPEIDKNIAPENQAPFWPYVTKYTKPFTLENVRALAFCLFWGVGSGLAALVIATVLQMMGLFDFQTALESVTNHQGVAVQTALNRAISIVLAIIALGPFTFYYIRYYFVSYVVLCEPDYEAGKINPLKYSSQVAKGLVIPILLILVIFFCADSLRAQLREQWPLQTMPILALAAAVVFELIGIYANILLFQIYRLKVESIPHIERPS